MERSLLLTASEMREAEARAVSTGASLFGLMLKAGEAVADRAVAMTGPGDRILVLCGPGNNGGDGFVAARLLVAAGRSVELASAKPVGALTGDAALAAQDWTGPVLPLEAARPEQLTLVVDALFGTGLGRDVDGPVADVIARVASAGTPVLSVDLPSGIDSDTGQVRGVAIRATCTLALGARKLGHLLYPGREHAGAVEIADIGIPPACFPDAGRTVVNDPEMWGRQLPRAGTAGHKYDRGHAIVVSGGPAHTGAARLAARGALRAGAGLVSLVTSARALSVNAAHLTAIMLRVADDPDEFSDLLTDDRFNALVLGPALGVGPSTRGWVQAALEADRGTVLDADALTSFAGEAGALRDAIGAGRETPVVLTPHDGEFRRLFAGPSEESADARDIVGSGSKLDRARRAAVFMGAVVVLKGPDTVIAAPDGRAAVNANGSAHLATAGSGDVLAGMIGGLLAQGMPGFEAASAAVWMHADAAERFGPGLIAEDLPDMLPQVWRDLL
ncbi:NAD(P)H-hydrate dehydratase [uncultured Enterovirga sp.]|uniref:NAD(P)H-hydrate dehydratase n=1 Tax=uncultured Enterovirga sp. TaxID=2026352 RepID=UPI0035CC4656